MSSILSTLSIAAAPAGAPQVNPLWATLPDGTSKLAAALSMEIIVTNGAFGIIRNEEVVLDGLTAADVDNYLMGYLNGKDNVDVLALVDELAKAETIIQILTANMSDGQRTKACNSLEAIGFPVRHATRCKERQAVIAVARGVTSAKF